MAQKGIARVGDTVGGTCYAHASHRAWTGTITTGTAGFKVDGQDAAAVGDTGNTSCGHHFQITGGSSVLTGVGGKIVARQGDPLIVIESGIGSITTGSAGVTSE
jgi:uncharacterized Zn-binding protein involved in type VI secretion